MSRLSKEYKYKVICEDKQMETFIRIFLEEQGINISRKVRFDIAPEKTCGEAYVRHQLPLSIDMMHVKNYNRITVIAFTDADTKSVDKRKQLLLEEVDSKGVAYDESTDCVFFMIPKRNIESWIKHFENGEVDEESVFDHLKNPRDCKTMAKTMSKMISEGRLNNHQMTSLCEVQRDFDRVCDMQSKRVS